MASRRRLKVVALDTQVTDRRARGGHPREVLVLGDLSVTIRHELAERGAVLTELSLLHEAFELLATQDFDVVVVNPFIDGGGLDFVNAIKEGSDEHQRTVATIYGARGQAAFLRGVRPPPLEVFDQARGRHRVTPFVVLPADATGSYSVVVVPPHASFMKDGRHVPITSTILTVDGAALLRTVGPLA